MIDMQMLTSNHASDQLESSVVRRHLVSVVCREQGPGRRDDLDLDRAMAPGHARAAHSPLPNIHGQRSHPNAIAPPGRHRAPSHLPHLPGSPKKNGRKKNGAAAPLKLPPRCPRRSVRQSCHRPRQTQHWKRYEHVCTAAVGAEERRRHGRPQAGILTKVGLTERRA